MTDRRLRRLIMLFAFLGLCVAIYLSLDRAGVVKESCPINGNPCLKVQDSKWGELAGIKVAYIGAVGYLVILLSLLVKGDNGRFITAALAVPGWAFSAYLTYHEFFSVKDICPYCVTSFLMITLVMVLSVWRLLRGEDPSAPPSDPDPPEVATP